ncbi:hypothetical protein K470DRAFT_222827 [Piedraia hortae CBS 480.64]|uniref:assimilatory sulfite reductase (NADPH) n=1 Tax=Piedraia hortae CBS 480.64 TaxID=1314780 RepID=A0A6A7BS22_9PEZI|nr:hypothetical protein K470DRAFT_222827 [Piedraia hortae CBS 480.64]
MTSDEVGSAQSSALPEGHEVSMSSFYGPSYVTAQVLVQQVAYGLSETLFSYSPEFFDLDLAAKAWKDANQKNSRGEVTELRQMSTRTGAGNIVLGYMFSPDFDLTKRHIPQSIIASAATLQHMRPVLDQLSLLHEIANPTVCHVAAVDYAPETKVGLVTDYCSAISLADDLGLGLISSQNTLEVQHMSLLSTLLASLLPTVHIYDGVNVGREITHVIDVQSQSSLQRHYYSVLKDVKDSYSSKRLTYQGKMSRLMQSFNSEMGTEYKCFEYHGHESPMAILVVFGTTEGNYAAQAARKLAQDGLPIGVVNVRVYRPFVEEEFLEAIPQTVQYVTVLGQVKDQSNVPDGSITSNLYVDVMAAVSFQGLNSGKEPSVYEIKYARETAWTEAKMEGLMRHLVRKPSEAEPLPKEIDSAANEDPASESEIGPDDGASAKSEKAENAENVEIDNLKSFLEEEPEPASEMSSWITAARGLAFKEAYDTTSSLRPDLSVKTVTVHVKERRRLTPLEYDRNIFHIEFDLGDSGLKYELGEALGIHAENNPVDVEHFIQWYGLDPDEVVEVASRNDPNVLEKRTVYQTLMQNLDLFGRPPKRFYEALAEFASDEKERTQLLMLGTGGNQESKLELQRRAEVDTITFADILLEFPSAHPGFQDIVRIVNPMKRREYSIASSQKVTPNSISLLVVTVNWNDPKGRDRFGQATRYLNSLSVGDPVTVSVKPSVMKLPPKTTHPIIMAGLGTGLAPFRAFVQERAWQREQGMPIGDIFLYMGSRHQREEYLYGEEWEAYQNAGIITLIGKAFSRDQPQKIYIQDRMRETMGDIRRAYFHQEGSFYLCGPTWPVPDVTAVLEEAVEIEAAAEGKKKNGKKEVERLKEDLRYVLEIY